MKSFLDGCEITQPQYVHLHQAEIFDVVLVKLADDHPFSGYFEGREVSDGIARDDHSTEMDAEVAGEAVYRLTDVEQLLERRSIEAGAAQLGQAPNGVPNAAGGNVRHRLADTIDERLGNTDRLADFADGGPGIIGVDRGDHPRVLHAIALRHVLDHLISAAGVEIDIHVWHLAPLRVQEALEQQPRGDRVNLRDAEQVAHQGIGGRTAPGAANAPRPRLLHDVPDDEEVLAQPQLADNLQLVA